MLFSIQLIVETVIQFFTVVFFFPLCVGILNTCKSVLELKQGPSIFQPSDDHLKLMYKESVAPENTRNIIYILPVSLLKKFIEFSTETLEADPWLQ